MLSPRLTFKKIFAAALLASLSFTAFDAAVARDNDNRGRDRDNRHDSDVSDRGGKAHQAWSRGQRISREDRRDSNVFYGWRESGLRQPPRGSQWFVLDGQYLLVQTRSGSIAEVRLVPPRAVERGDGDRDQLWRQRYRRSYDYNDDVAYTECRSQPDPAGVLAGAFLGAVIGNAAGGRHDRGGATAAGVIAGGTLGAALTSKMDCSDRSYAYQTYSLGFNGGRADAHYRWTNPQNQHRGEMHVLDYYRDEDNFRCAVFVQTVYRGNRSEEVRGRACQQPNGTWTIID